ncbi:hypothetical protein HJC23_005002 [Cyclotella cryptica]|uniref:DOT1 domain-containing protein n=1 Tax=Cyclotella cryptica TaxID=29204 RepID=A0ABD3QE43_9STRA|eukprot:CCRYP_006214-RA/>CCRYP_006214-RA protein AED:0.02 eAED:0.02 QI:229/1/1/1/1/1/2/162/392
MSLSHDEIEPNRNVSEVATPTKRSKSLASRAEAASEPPAKGAKMSEQSNVSSFSPLARSANIVTPSTSVLTPKKNVESTTNTTNARNARRSLTPAIKKEAPKEKKLPFGGTSKSIAIANNVRRVYRIVNKHTGSIGGNSHGGAIYGELTVGSMQKMTNLMIEHTGLGKESRFIDVGCGLGKPNLHVAQMPGVEFSFGIELCSTRWMLGIANLHQILQRAKMDEVEGRSTDLIGHRCVLEHGDIREANFFDPFTHVYMFDIGFPPLLFHVLSDMFNKSSSEFLICYHGPKLMIDTYEFDVELIVQTPTSMHGSSEVHTGYIYKRAQKSKIAGSRCKTKTFGVPCDPLFAAAWKTCKSGLDGVLKHVAQHVDEHIGSTEKRITRSAAKKAHTKA